MVKNIILLEVLEAYFVTDRTSRQKSVRIQKASATSGLRNNLMNNMEYSTTVGYILPSSMYGEGDQSHTCQKCPNFMILSHINTCSLTILQLKSETKIHCKTFICGNLETCL